MTPTVISGRVIKPSNGGTALYVKVRYDQSDSTAGSVAQAFAQAHGWDPDGRAESGWPTGYGIDTHERTFRFEHCLCHHSYPDMSDPTLQGIRVLGFACFEGPELVKEEAQ